MALAKVQPNIQGMLAWASAALVNLKLAQVSSALHCDPLPGDAGFRRYFRINAVSQTQTWLLVHSPPATESNEAFVALAKGLRTHGVPTPTLLALEQKQGWMLIEDFGDQWLLSALQAMPHYSDALYGKAVDALLALQKITPEQLGYSVPEYDTLRLQTEMQLMNEWFSEKLLRYSITPSENQILQGLHRHLIESALAQPQVLVHRDYHARNLMLTQAQTLGVIDFQDAVWGPITYDVASLFRDCYHRWPQDQVNGWAWQYAQKAMENHLLPKTVCRPDFQQWFDWMGLQRHIKVLGIFARLALRDGKTQYLQDLPLVMRYTLEVADSYDETRTFARWFRKNLLPLAEKQPWYQDVANAQGQR